MQTKTGDLYTDSIFLYKLFPKPNPKMHTEYCLAEGYSTKEIEKSVMALIRQGWQPLGAVSIITITSGGVPIICYAQAMVR